MNAVVSASLHFNQMCLADALRCQFTPAQWVVLASYLQPFVLTAGQVLMKKGS